MTTQPVPRLMPAQLTVLVVRHGSTDLTGRALNGCGADAADPDLNALGRDQIGRLGESLRQGGYLDRVDQVFTSTARRAVASAEALTDGRPDIDSRLCEVDFGNWEGRSPAELWKTDQQGFSQWQSDPAVAPPGGTSLVAVAHRVRHWRAQVHAQVPDGGHLAVLAVAHASTVRILVADALSLSLAHATRIEAGPGAGALVHFWADGGSSLESLIPSPR